MALITSGCARARRAPPACSTCSGSRPRPVRASSEPGGVTISHSATPSHPVPTHGPRNWRAAPCCCLQGEPRYCSLVRTMTRMWLTAGGGIGCGVGGPGALRPLDNGSVPLSPTAGWMKAFIAFVQVAPYPRSDCDALPLPTWPHSSARVGVARCRVNRLGRGLTAAARAVAKSMQHTRTTLQRTTLQRTTPSNTMALIVSGFLPIRPSSSTVARRSGRGRCVTRSSRRWSCCRYGL